MFKPIGLDKWQLIIMESGAHASWYTIPVAVTINDSFGDNFDVRDISDAVKYIHWIEYTYIELNIHALNWIHYMQFSSLYLFRARE